MPSAKLRRNTPQRKVILAELCAVTTHPTAAELYDLVRRRMPRISLGTVYRNLEVLHRDGLIRKLEFSGTEARFDGVTAEHYHVRCRECGRVADVDDPGLSNQLAQPRKLAGFQVESHRLEYIGLCPECFPTEGNQPSASL